MSSHRECEYNCGGTGCPAPDRPMPDKEIGWNEIAKIEREREKDINTLAICAVIGLLIAALFI